ncbi:MAG: T9SS type A sorting domain-containing protein [Ignavibacteria bacterium]|nr:T9SS type A sorting domain-containing protein [Ignavibacteria bacterium]
MNRIIVATIVVLFGYHFQFTESQQVTTEWVLNIFNGFPVGVMIGIDNDDNIVVTGHAGDFTKIITTKYDTNGTLIWERFYSVPNLGVAASWLSVDPAGNIIVTGYPRTISSNPVESGLLTLKYDNNGNLLWDKLIQGTWAFAIRSIVDQFGNIYVTGRAWQYTVTYDFVTVKYAPDGTQLWFDTFDQNGGFHTPTSMELDQSNNLFITGTGLSGGLITVMYNTNGERQWVREETGTPGQSIRVDNTGGIFITGSYYDVNTGTGNDIRLIKYDYSGNLLWQKFYDFGGSEYGKLINIDSQSNIFITGYGDLPGAFLGWLTTKFDSSGNLLWYNRFKLNQSWEEYPYFALTGPEDEIYITGNVGVVSGGTTYHGLETVRYNSDGSNGWIAGVNQYAGIGKGLAFDNDLNLYAVGQFYYSVIKYSQLIPTNNEEVSNDAPERFYLEQNYPNPFNPTTKISFSIPSSAFALLKVYDVLGNEVTTLISEEKPAGNYEVIWNATNLPSGNYFYTLTSGSFSQTKKMILLK